jgi:hypothetical protein
MVVWEKADGLDAASVGDKGLPVDGLAVYWVELGLRLERAVYLCRL